MVAPFLRGYAPTDLAPDGDYSVRALAADAVALRWALAGDDGTAILVGHDWGATAAYAVPGGVFDRVVTIAVPPPSTLLGLPATLAARQARRSWYIAFQQLPGVAERALPRLLPRLWRDWSPDHDPAEDLDRLWDALDTPERRTAALTYYRHLRKLRARDLRDAALSDAYLHGADDGCLLADVARRVSGVHVVEGAGHFVQLERPEVVAETVGGPASGDPLRR